MGEVYIPQDMNYPGLRLNVDRVHAGELGLTQKEVIDNVITALNSNYMIAPNYWVDYKTGNDYYLTVQYYEKGGAAIHNLAGLEQYSAEAPSLKEPTTLDTVVKLRPYPNAHRVRSFPDPESKRCLRDACGEDLGKLTDGASRHLVSDSKHSGWMSTWICAAWCRG